MQIGMIGLGRMGANIARRLMRHGHDVVVHDRSRAAMDDVARDGAKPAATIEAMIKQLTPPRAVWVMLPAGEATETTIAQLAELLAAGDAVIDGGNTFWRDDLRRAAIAQAARAPSRRRRHQRRRARDARAAIA